MLADGRGLAVRVKLAVLPSFAAALALETLTTGVFGGGSSLSVMVSMWTRREPTR